MTKRKIIIYTDGGSRGNPGPAGAGAYITDSEGKKLKGVSKFLGVQTNNFAEYEAVILGLHEIKKCSARMSKTWILRSEWIASWLKNN